MMRISYDGRTALELLQIILSLLYTRFCSIVQNFCAVLYI